ncbi:FxLD family lantipeptide [Streptomyces sp. NPDC086787]|uniref:FxLD family lantipeptide n=1 Tax=Streptomyces sp. NPDC086787 TaxID=3365759 RepID=UPI003803FB22
MTYKQSPPPAVVDPFDLDLVLIEAGELVTILDSSNGGCGATCGTGSCTTNVA